MSEFSLDFAWAGGEPEAQATFRLEPEDFRVDEELGFSPAGEGEHVYLQLRKRNQNTQWLARQIADFCGVRPLDVGYSGLKDRHAVTSQWFSVYLPKASEPDWSAFQLEEVQLLARSRHSRKLKPGSHRANRFQIRLRDVEQSDGLDTRLEASGQGVPNYFGEQRFGIDAGNLRRAEDLLVQRRPIRNRKQRGLMISAARSWLFNQVLSRRVADDNWRQTLPGDCGEEPSGPLWGRGRPLVSGETAALESEILGPWRAWCEGLEHVGLQQERRPLICRPLDFSGQWEDRDLLLSFGLAPGQYATSVLRQIARLHNAAHDDP